MHPQQSSRIDLGNLRAQIVKRLGPETSKRYFYYLNRLLSQKLSKSEFDKFCHRVLGRENLPLHNQLIRSILKNAFQAKTPPVYEAGAAKSTSQITEISPEDGNELSGSGIPSQRQNVLNWSNGVLPVSPKKGRSGIRDRKLKDRPSSLGPNGKVEYVSHQSTGAVVTSGKEIMENGGITLCDYQRPVQHLHGAAEQPDRMVGSAQQPSAKPGIAGNDQTEVAYEDGEEVEQVGQWNSSRSPLLAPLGIPYCSASVGGSRKAIPAGGASDFVSFYDSGGLPDTETLRKRMEQIAVVQGLGGVSMECSNMLNNMLDVYLKRLIRSCFELVRAGSARDPRNHLPQKRQVQRKLVNGTWPSNHPYIETSNGSMDTLQEQTLQSTISMLDFRVSMELNPQQLGDDWPLHLEKISMQSFEE